MFIQKLIAKVILAAMATAKTRMYKADNPSVHSVAETTNSAVKWLQAPGQSPKPQSKSQCQ